MKDLKSFWHIKDELVILSPSTMAHSADKTNKLHCSKVKRQILPMASHSYGSVTLVQHRYGWQNGFCLFLHSVLQHSRSFTGILQNTKL